ncbi:hypothetical protein FFLO_03346 [Filobasidium floriforme]|uniref:Dolichyl-diphosphooligosaccharide-protein glycosyltransferase subunit OST5 n=1 Tax=Filobasidium floriforme TaxID=5210 RepID=A0A8K0NQB5_9TREE|nr:uncharacterized protein HD553DRAFT_310141 [Filobasidium floriforme]KAG7544233.1 hypothetical protein FFLO_03346 [Filobasidium floriforme]KAH8085743.1 hypothetical protein HD553DRAFT_310141 [Filobasidium floriforme]
MSSYTQAQELFLSSSPTTSPLPVSALPTIAFLTLAASFVLTFWFTTLPPKARSIPLEIFSALGASSLAGIGAVALFCTVGVYV